MQLVSNFSHKMIRDWIVLAIKTPVSNLSNRDKTNILKIIDFKR